jgi:hypothetical protein
MEKFSEFEQINEFPTNPEHLAVALAYRNRKMIADSVLPRVPVGRRTFTYWKYLLEEAFHLPDTKVGKFDKVGEHRWPSESASASVANHGLAEPVSNEDIGEAPEGVDPLAKATARLQDQLMLAREKRVVDLVFDANQYGSNNKDTLSGSDQFDDEDSNPLATLIGYLESLPWRPNRAVIPRPIWTVLRQHPLVVKAVNRNSGDSGVVALQDVANLLELDEILIGDAFANTAVKGQTPTLTRLWGNKILLFTLNSLADTSGGLSFGFTAQRGGPVVKTITQGERGLDGVQKQVVGERVQELIIAPATGFLISEVLSA